MKENYKMYKSTRNELLRDSNIELYTENQELKREVKFLQEELDATNEILDNIGAILYRGLPRDVAEKIYNEIFEIEGQSIWLPFIFVKGVMFIEDKGVKLSEGEGSKVE